MKIKLRLLFLIVTAACAGCAKKSKDDKGESADKPGAFALGSVLLESLCRNDAGDSSGDLSQKVSADVNAFSGELSAGLLAVSENRLVSPLSVQYALAMLHAGASGESKTQLEEVLKLDASGYEVGPGFKALSRNLRCPSTEGEKIDLGSVGFHLANAVWGSEANPLADAYVNGVREDFAAEAHALNFGDGAAAADAINGWSKEASYGTIPSVVQPTDFSSATRFVLTNAAHYKAKWKRPFAASDTADLDFIGVTGAKTRVATMRMTKLDTLYVENDDYQAVRLAYDNDDSMTLVVPKEAQGLGAMLASKAFQAFFAASDAVEWKNNLVNLWLPKFKIEGGADLVASLKALGLTAVFVESSDLAGMLASPESQFVSNVFQKGFIDVHEEGTEAAAVTVVTDETTSVPADHPQEVDLRVDHPFFYMIERKGTVIFTGVVADPS